MDDRDKVLNFYCKKVTNYLKTLIMLLEDMTVSEHNKDRIVSGLIEVMEKLRELWYIAISEDE